MITGIILAAGKGKRFKNKTINKTAVNYLGKPLILFGVELFESICATTFVVVGHAAESVKKALFSKKVVFVIQNKPLGTGDALKCAVKKIEKNNLKPTLVLVGYGDHMMFYDRLIINDLIGLHHRLSSSITLITTRHSQPDLLSWGRVIRGKSGFIEKIVEQKDADEDEKKVTELNAGLYCFNYDYLKKEIYNLRASNITGEYYLTDLVGKAIEKDLIVSGLEVPFEKVGIGINTRKEKKESEKLFRKVFRNLSSN